MTDSLPEDKHNTVLEMSKALANIKGVQAICLGGSYARGTATASSDIDIGIYYSEHFPPLISDIHNLAKTFDPIDAIQLLTFMNGVLGSMEGHG